MPRGGRRPGAGAPKGNFNAVRSGNHSRRLLMVYLAVMSHPDWKALAKELHEGGFFPPPHHKFNEDIRGLVAYLYRRWFDRPAAGQSTTISNDQLRAIAASLPPSRQIRFRPLPLPPLLPAGKTRRTTRQSKR